MGDIDAGFQVFLAYTTVFRNIAPDDNALCQLLQ